MPIFNWMNPKKKTPPPMVIGGKRHALSLDRNDAAPSTFKPMNSPFSQTLLRALAKEIPSVSTAIWVWKNLVETPIITQFEGSEEGITRAKAILAALFARTSPLPHVKGNNINTIISTYLDSTLTIGKFCAIVNISPSSRNIESIHYPDPSNIRFDNDMRAWFIDSRQQATRINNNTFHYFAMNASPETPYGFAMTETAASFIDLAQKMLKDMTLSSSNAGIPRLHIKIKPPEKATGEHDATYSNRAASYFAATVSQFQELEPDDNVFTWDDVVVSTISDQSSVGFTWRQNRGIIDEEVITAFHLYPWVMAKSFSTTKNWVRSQYDLLMSQVSALQASVTAYLDWIANMELQLNGLHNVSCTHAFAIARDPEALLQARANQTLLDTAIKKAAYGIITPEAACRELGYASCADPKLFMQATKEQK